METEKTSAVPKESIYHHSAGKMVLAIILFLVVTSLAFAAGRISSHNRISASRFGQYGMMGSSFAGSDRRVNMMGREQFGNIGSVRRGGLTGQITDINGNTLTVKDTDGTEYTVNVETTTSIIISGKIDKLSNLKLNNSVVIHGKAKSDGTIDANAITTL